MSREIKKTPVSLIISGGLLMLTAAAMLVLNIILPCTIPKTIVDVETTATIREATVVNFGGISIEIIPVPGQTAKMNWKQVRAGTVRKIPYELMLLESGSEHYSISSNHFGPMLSVNGAKYAFGQHSSPDYLCIRFGEGISVIQGEPLTENGSSRKILRIKDFLPSRKKN